MYTTARLNIHNKIIKQVALKHNVDADVVAKMVKAQWDLLAKAMDDDTEENKLTGLKVKYLGIFGVKNNKLKYTKKYSHFHVPRILLNKLININPKRWREQVNEQGIEYKEELHVDVP